LAGVLLLVGAAFAGWSGVSANGHGCGTAVAPNPHGTIEAFGVPVDDGDACRGPLRARQRTAAGLAVAAMVTLVGAAVLRNPLTS
jgi:hypothetical protein